MNQSIRWKLTLFVAGVVILTAGSLSVASYMFARRTLRQQIHDRLSVVASDRQKLLLGFIQQQHERVSLVSSRTRLRQLLEQFTAGQTPEEQFRGESRRILEDAQHSSAGCEAIWTTDAIGRVVAATDDSYLGQDQANSPDFLDGRNGAQLRVARDAAGRYQAVLSAPARSGSDQLVGVVMMLVDAEPIMQLLADRTGLGETGAVMVGRRVGDQIRFVLMGDSGTKTLVVSPDEVPAMAAATEGKAGFKQTRDWQGKNVLAAYRPAGYRDWGIVTKIDVAEAYAPIADLRRLFINIEVAVLVAGLVFAYLLARRFTKPLLRMVSMVESISTGALHTQVAVESRDEVGRLGEAFNKMGEELAHSYALLEDRVKQRTAELRASQEQTRQIVETALDAFLAIDANSVIIDWNKDAERTFGWSREEALGRRLADTIIPPQHREEHEKGMRRFLATGEGPVLNRRLEMTALRRDGREFPVEFTIASVRRADSFVFNAFLHDISERRQREQALREAEAKYRQLVEQLPAITYIAEFGPAGRWLYVSPQVEALLGYSAAEWMSQTDFWIGQLHADDRERVLREEAQSHDTREPFRSEYRLLTRDGRALWVRDSATVVLDGSGQPVYLHGVMLDITDRKRAEQQLNRYFTLSPDLFCIADYRGYFQRVNPAWSAVLGYTEEEIRAQPFLSFVHPDDLAATRGEYEQNLKSQRSIQFENRYRCKDGSYRWLQWNAIPVPEEQLIHAVARDVTEYKRAQELLADYADALNKQNHEMQQDLKMAREVHQVFIPQTHPIFPRSASLKSSALQFWHRYLPTSALGGDFFEILQLSDTQAGIFICDVMGHGMRAALVTSILRGLMDKYRDCAHEPGQFLAEINQALLTNLKTCSTTIFATAAYVIIDAANGQVRYANAGHPSPFLLRKARNTIESLEAQVLPHAGALGLFQDLTYPVAVHQLSVGDAVLLYTDGLYEVEGRDGEQFGFERLQDTVRRRVNLPGEKLLDELVLETRRYSATGEFTDDVCLVGVEFAAKI